MQSFKNLNLEMKYCFSQKKTIKLMNESGGYGGVGVVRKFFEKKISGGGEFIRHLRIINSL